MRVKQQHWNVTRSYSNMIYSIMSTIGYLLYNEHESSRRGTCRRQKKIWEEGGSILSFLFATNIYYLSRYEILNKNCEIKYFNT